MKTNDIYQMVTDQIITLLEGQLDGARRPWISLDGDNEPSRNPLSQGYYRGINQFVLSFVAHMKEYPKNEFATFKQIKDAGGHVLKGSKSLPVIFYKTAYIDKTNRYYSPETVKQMSLADYKDKGINTAGIIKLYKVFNLATQTEGLDPQHYETPQKAALVDVEIEEGAMNIICETGATIHEKASNHAYYDRTEDAITLPLREQFNGNAEQFVRISMHELGHWTGAPQRLNRTFGKYGDPDYAKEELVAEMISAFVCTGHLGYEVPITSNAAYIKNWLSILKNDNRAVLKAAAAAQRGADYIIGGAECVDRSYV